MTFSTMTLSPLRPFRLSDSLFFIGSPSVKTSDNLQCDQMPSVHKHEYDDLQRQGDHDRRQHDHTKAHENTCHNQVNDNKRYEDQHSDLESGPQLADHESWDQDIRWHLVLVVRTKGLGKMNEKSDIIHTGLLEHELPYGPYTLVIHLFCVYLFFKIGFQGVVIDLLHGRSHDKEGHENREGHDDLVGGNILRGECPADELEDHGYTE